jgi:ribosomal protein S18 acetylase RimI-like enzyme
VSLEIHAATADRWTDMVTLFERRGKRGGHRNTPAYGCWCMYWRDRTVEHGEKKKRAMEKLFRSGREPGLLAYENGEPVGWVAVARREEYTPLLRSPQYRPRDGGGGPDVWSIVCFTIDKYARRKGIASALLDAAVEQAFAHGATSVEAYPHVAKPLDYMGNIDLFRRAGFASVWDANKRAIVRLDRPVGDD